MTDIVERLRLMAGPLSAGLSKSGRLAECLPACLEAAEEIERLRKQRNAMVEALGTENERLTAALERAVKAETAWDGIEIARAALSTNNRGGTE
jgi:hypothetical protein